jgi:hypothetical protein
MALSCVIADKGVIESGAKLKQFVLANLTALKVPPKALAVIQRSKTSEVFTVPLRFRSPLSLLTASISKGSVCVAGDALHPMTPDLGQGGCAAAGGQRRPGQVPRRGREGRHGEPEDRGGVARVRWDPAMEERRARCYGLCGRLHSAE